MEASRIKRATLVADHNTSHLDPLTAAPAKNKFLTTVLPFLKDTLHHRRCHCQGHGR
jgi:hypothetical protein